MAQRGPNVILEGGDVAQGVCAAGGHVGHHVVRDDEREVVEAGEPLQLSGDAGKHRRAHGRVAAVVAASGSDRVEDDAGNVDASELGHPRDVGDTLHQMLPVALLRRPRRHHDVLHERDAAARDTRLACHVVGNLQRPLRREAFRCEEEALRLARLAAARPCRCHGLQRRLQQNLCLADSGRAGDLCQLPAREAAAEVPVDACTPRRHEACSRLQRRRYLAGTLRQRRDAELPQRVFGGRPRDAGTARHVVHPHHRPDDLPRRDRGRHRSFLEVSPPPLRGRPPVTARGLGGAGAGGLLKVRGNARCSRRVAAARLQHSPHVALAAENRVTGEKHLPVCVWSPTRTFTADVAFTHKPMKYRYCSF
eukprot:Rhum_TRINITY_DN5422_c0_g1::Rhum_TRINITY_DN5422_c0_g1_i1::g.17374::m.17374